MTKLIKNVSAYETFLNEMHTCMTKFNSFVADISDKQKQLELRQKLLLLQQLYNALEMLLKKDDYVSDFILADYKTKIIKTKQDFENSIAISKSQTNVR